MTSQTTSTRTIAALCALTMLGAGAGAAQARDGGQPQRALDARSEALNQQYRLAGTEAAGGSDAAEWCRTVGTPTGIDRFLCYRVAAESADESRVSPATVAGTGPPPRPIVVEDAGIDWTDAGIGFVAAAGLGALVAGSAVVARSRRQAGARVP